MATSERIPWSWFGNVPPGDDHQSQPIIAVLILTNAANFGWCEHVTICKPDVPRSDQSSLKCDSVRTSRVGMLTH